jgi:predicted metal-binding membrane protein
MFAALALVFPLGLGGAVSPVMLTEQTVLLAGPGGVRAGTRFALGAIIALTLIVIAVVLFGRAISLPTEPQLDATLDLILGVILLVAAIVVFALGRRRRGPGARVSEHGRRADVSRRDRAALPFGVFAMATNFTTLALIVPAAKEVSSAGVDVAGRMVLVVLLVVLASTPAWAPVVLTLLAPGTSQRALTALGEQITRHGRAASVVLLGAAGLFLAGRGILRLLG